VEKREWHAACLAVQAVDLFIIQWAAAGGREELTGRGSVERVESGRGIVVGKCSRVFVVGAEAGEDADVVEPATTQHAQEPGELGRGAMDVVEDDQGRAGQRTQQRSHDRFNVGNRSDWFLPICATGFGHCRLADE
jgi:hypothetical protein